MKVKAKYEITGQKGTSGEIHSGVLLDQIIKADFKETKAISKLKIRKIKFYIKKIKERLN